MKKTVLSLLLVSLVGITQAADKAGQIAIGLVQTGATFYASQQGKHPLSTEKELRKDLYWKDANNPYYYLLEGFPFDYYIAVLTNHKKVLENKIGLKKSVWRSGALKSGLILSALSALVVYASYAYYQKSLSEYFIKKPHKSQEWMTNAIGFGALSALFVAAAGKQLYKTYHYSERVIKRLARDKRILATLQREKALLESKNAENENNIVAAAASKLINTITTAIDAACCKKE